MIELDWGKWRRARIWLEELPPATFDPSATIERPLAIRSNKEPAVRRAAIEVVVPRGARTEYGLLGFDMTCDATSQLILRVGQSDEHGPRYERTLAYEGALAHEDVRIGLPREYGAAVLTGAARSLSAMDGACGGTLMFGCAAHGRIGSNQRTFSSLSAALVHLPWMNEDARKEARLAELLRSSFE